MAAVVPPSPDFYEGIAIIGGSSGTTNLLITDTLVIGIGGNTNGIHNLAPSGTTGYISATRVTVSDCHFASINDPLGNGTMKVSNTMATGNSVGFINFVGTFQTPGNNHVGPNTTTSAGIITYLPPY